MSIDQPTAIPNPEPTFAQVTQPQSGTNVAPPAAAQNHDDPALLGFHKIAAERRSRANLPPVVVPFGTGTIRIHTTMSAGFAFDAAAVEADPFAAKRMIRDAIIEADQAHFDEVMKLPPDNEHGVDGPFLLAFLMQLAEFYGGRPLGG